MSRKRDKAEVQIVRETPQAMGSAVAAIKTSSRTDRGLSGRNSGPHVCPHYTGYSLRFSVYPTAARAGNWQSRQTSAGGICVSARNVIKTGSHDNACRVACRRFSVQHPVFPQQEKRREAPTGGRDQGIAPLPPRCARHLPRRGRQEKRSSSPGGAKPQFHLAAIPSSTADAVLPLPGRRQIAGADKPLPLFFYSRSQKPSSKN